MTKHDAMVRRLGNKGAYHQAVAEGDIDIETQEWLGHEACLELWTFTHWSTHQRMSSRAAGQAWRKLSPEYRNKLILELDVNARREAMRQRGAGFAMALISSGFATCDEEELVATFALEH